MTSEFEADLRTATAELEAARSDLLDVINGLSGSDLQRGKRGGWAVAAILQHVIGGESHYTRAIERLRGRRGADAAVLTLELAKRPGLAAPEDATRYLETTRRHLLAALDGIDEETFYELRTLKTQEQEYGQEYSVLSVLQNLAMHDREHTAQIGAILAPTREPPSARGEEGS